MRLLHPSLPAVRHRAFALLAVLVFVMLLSMVTVSLLYSSRAEEAATASGAGGEQAWSVAMSGVDEALRVAATAPPGSLEWRDQPAVFRQRLVYEDGSDQWYFSVYSTSESGDSESEVRYGLTDEASRLNLNRPGSADLANLPRMTPVLAQAVRRFIGSSSAGATPPSPATPDSAAEGPSNQGPLGSVGELLQVPGFTWSLLYGEDANLNGRLDPNENDGDVQFPPDNQDGILDRGMRQYFTIRSYETPRTREGQKRMNLNEPVELPPGAGLPPALTNYLAALHTAKLKLTHPAELLEAQVHVKQADGKELDVASGITKEELPRVLDLFTADDESRREGLININTASAAVLATLPGVDLSLAETIAATRASLSPERRSTTAWLYQDGLVDADRFKRIAPQLTARSFQFQFRIVGYAVPSGRYRVVEAEIDVADGERRVTGLKDITKLGIPFRLTGDELQGSASDTSGAQRK